MMFDLKQLIGRTITAIEFDDHLDMGEGKHLALILDDGTKLVPMRDSEGNGPGEIFIGLTNGDWV